jgi:carnitine O-palmitoyltransferase 2
MRRIPFSDIKRNVQALPRLPIPSIDDTLNRYSASIKPLKRQHRVARHLEKVEAFRAGSASRLQQSLVETDASRDGYPFSYIESIWDDLYLGARPSTILTGNTAIGLKRIGALQVVEPDVAESVKVNRVSYKVLKEIGQAQAAALTTHSIVKYIADILANGVPVPPPAKDGSLFDVSQMGEQFCTSRCPKVGRDVKVKGDLTKDANAVTVLHDGHIYIVKVRDSTTGAAFSVEVLTEAFNHILGSTPVDDNPAPVSALTSLPRDDWAAMRSELIKTPANQESLEAIDKSICVICLDTDKWNTPQEKHANALYGGRNESESRWYDKHQFIVSADGQISANYEHAFSDGATWLHWTRAVMDDVQFSVLSNAEGCSEAVVKQFTPLPSVPIASSATGASLVQPVEIVFGKSFVASIRQARTAAAAMASRFGGDYAHIPVGSNDLKALNCSPDAFIQLSLMLAYFKKHDKLPPTYEASSTARFFHGRTETLRTATNSARAFVELYRQKVSPNHVVGHAQMYEAIQNFSAEHRKQAQLCSVGQGVDRHLRALRAIAEKEAGPAALAAATEKINHSHASVEKLAADGKTDAALQHAFGGSVDNDALNLFLDPDYKRWNSWTLSTSNISVPCMDAFLFPPVIENGYGVGYVIDESCMIACITDFTSCTATDSTEYKTGVVEASLEILAILQKQARQ